MLKLFIMAILFNLFLCQLPSIINENGDIDKSLFNAKYNITSSEQLYRNLRLRYLETGFMDIIGTLLF